MKSKNIKLPLNGAVGIGGLFLLVSSASAQIVLPQQDSNCLSCHSATPASLANVTVNEIAGCDYSNAALYSGWGWSNAARMSCPPQNSDVLEGAYAHDGSRAPGPMPQTCIDSDGDGWGWDGTASCRVGVVPPTPGPATCVDSDGDGWGWNGTASCRVEVGPPPPPGPGPSTCVDPDGDGWGWNGTESCKVDPIIIVGGCQTPASGTTLVSSTGPVRSTGNSYYPDNGPQCVTPNNQFNGPGLGFGDFLLSNNAWNGDKSTWNWSQCISLTPNTGGSVAPSWAYDWGNEDDLQPGYQEWEVKSYPEILFGEKSNTEVSGSCTETGLPVKYSDMPDIDIAYSYRSTQTNNRVGDLGDENNNPVPVTGGDRNIAVESFLHASCDIKRGADSNREFELMVWLDHGAERLPSGSPPISTYTDASGGIYDVYVKGAADPGYIAYVARNEVTSGTLDWDAFFDDAKNNAGSYGIKAINEDWCLANILFGSEIWWGEGDFTLDQYQITQSY